MMLACLANLSMGPALAIDGGRSQDKEVDSDYDFIVEVDKYSDHDHAVHVRTFDVNAACTHALMMVMMMSW